MAGHGCYGSVHPPQAKPTVSLWGGGPALPLAGKHSLRLNAVVKRSPPRLALQGCTRTAMATLQLLARGCALALLVFAGLGSGSSAAQQPLRAPPYLSNFPG